MTFRLKYIFTTLFFPLVFSFIISLQKEQTITLSFYSEQPIINYNQEMILHSPSVLEEQEIVAYYRAIEESSYESLLNSLRKYHQQYGLNDWLLYELTKKSIEKIFNGKPRRQKTLINWFLLSKFGYDTRLAFLKNEVYIYVRTNDNIYETPLIEDEGNKFVGLTEMQQKRTNRKKAVYLLNFLAAPNGKPFSFSLNKLPNLKAVGQPKTFKFNWEGEVFELPIKLDKTLVDIMKNYPVIGETDYLETPFSKELKRSLLPNLRKIIKDKTIKESLEILTTFTRSAFRYREDEDYFGRSKPMIREEVFFYPYSDCEDRSAVFYGLVEELLDLPMIVVAFRDHLTIAVALDQPIGPSIKYKGKKFYICDPTGPSNSSEIGKPPKGYERRSFEILSDNF